MASVISVVCAGTKRTGTHSERTVARYQWSDADSVWERIDHHGSDNEWFIKGTTPATLIGYPTPRLKCPCGRDDQPRHEELQVRLQLAEPTGKLVL